MPAVPDRDRQRLAGQRRLIDDALLALDHPVHRHDLTGTHDQTVAGHDHLDRHLDEAVAPPHQRISGRPLDQHGQLARRPPVSPLLERVPAGQHQRHHRARQVLAQRKRPGHRHQRDRINTDIAPQQRPHNRHRQRHQQQRSRRRPKRVRNPGLSHRPGRKPADNTTKRRQRDQPP